MHFQTTSNDRHKISHQHTHTHLLFPKYRIAKLKVNSDVLTNNKTKNNKKDFNELILNEKDTSYIITSNNFSIVIAKTDGALHSFIFDNQEQIFSPLLPNYSRPRTDNDRRGWKPHKKMKEWYHPELKLENIKVEKIDRGQIKFQSSYSLIKAAKSDLLELLVIDFAFLAIQAFVQSPTIRIGFSMIVYAERVSALVNFL